MDRFKELTIKTVNSKTMLMLRIISALCKRDVVLFVVSQWIIIITTIATISWLKVKEAAIGYITVLVDAPLVIYKFSYIRHI